MSSSSFYISDPWLNSYADIIDKRIEKCRSKEKQLADSKSLNDFAIGHLYYGLHRDTRGWVFREWAPNATEIFIIGTFTGWKEKPEYEMKRVNHHGDWEIVLPVESMKHGDLFKL